MLINGEPEQSISALDRGLLYGDGLFETIRLHQGRLLLWSRHLKRLLDSCQTFGIVISPDELVTDVDKLLRNQPCDGIIKIIVTRGTGGRGYRPLVSGHATRIVQYFPLAPDLELKSESGVHTRICRQTLGQGSLAGHKHLNRLEQVLAAGELSADLDEGIMLNRHGQVIEGIRSNIFLVSNEQLCSPDLSLSGVNGVMRAYLLKQFADSGRPVIVRAITLTELLQAQEVFLCNSVLGVWPVVSLQYEDTRIEFARGRHAVTAQGFFATALQNSEPSGKRAGSPAEP